MFLHEIDGFSYDHSEDLGDAFEYDSLSSDERWDDNFDVILANPPFMTPKGGRLSWHV